MIVFDLINAKQGPNEQFNKFAQRFQKIWSMIPKPLSTNHVTSMFIDNIHPKLKYITLNYMTPSFTKLVNHLTQKEKCLVKIGNLKYENPSK